ncbi:MAG: hypothetical protein PF485_11875 [Bacteroidales bacterium]|jgi:hypothetical protein|nr:hypothetical protein [Bacteroidales bacterium]
MQLSLDQFRIIERDVQSEGITFSHLECDLLDHVCCDIEDRMRTGFSFDDAYQTVKREIGIQGLRRVQEETLLLINKNYRMMKKSMKILGTIALAGVSIAAVAKIMHWPGASLLILLSTFIVSTIFFPAVLYVWYKEVFLKKHGFIVILTFFAGFTFMYGTLFKIQHWPFANILLIIGELLTIITIIIGGITYLISKPTSKDRKGLLVIGIIGLVAFALGTLFKIQHWPGATILLLLGSILLFSVFLPIYAYHTYKGETTIKNSFIFSVFALMFIITFTFLLSIKSSQSILDAYAYRVNELHSSISTIENLIKDIPEKENSVEITQKADVLFNSITDLKNNLVNITGGTNINVNQLKIEDIKYLKHSSTNKSYTNLLEGNMQNGKAYLLYNDIQKYKSFIINGLENNPYSMDLVNENLFLPQDNPKDWIIQNFYLVPLVTSLNNLSQIQLDIRLVQQEALNNMNLALVENIQE